MVHGQLRPRAEGRFRHREHRRRPSAAVTAGRAGDALSQDAPRPVSPGAMTTSTDSPRARDDLERHRPRLFGIAYRMLGNVHEAEDTVQEAMLRWHREDRAGIESPEAWLVAVTTRLRSEEHTSELQSRQYLVCRLL